jgi:DNA-binding GntR family transcriptional regulator
MELAKLDNSNLWDKTYMILKDLIVRREFKPNEKLSIPELSAKLGVSRTPLRDALTRLEMEGLVKTISKVGTFVNAISIDEVLDIIDTRLMLEYWVVEKLPLLPEKEYWLKTQQLEELLDEAVNWVEKKPLGSYLRSDYNLRFHMEFIKMGNNQKNVDIYLGMMNYHYLASENALFTREMVTSAIEQHYRIIAALKKKDFAAVKQAVKEHLDDAKSRLIERLLANGGQI